MAAVFHKEMTVRIMTKNTGLSITIMIKNKQLDLSFYEELQVC